MKLQACINETQFRSIVHYPTLLLVWPIKYGTNLIQTKMDGFEASRFILSRVTDVLSIQAHIHLKEALLEAAHVPLSTTIDMIHSMHLVLVSSPNTL